MTTVGDRLQIQHLLEVRASQQDLLMVRMWHVREREESGTHQTFGLGRSDNEQEEGTQAGRPVGLWLQHPGGLIQGGEQRVGGEG